MNVKYTFVFFKSISRCTSKFSLPIPSFVFLPFLFLFRGRCLDVMPTFNFVVSVPLHV